jgi:hypothetical protein
MGVRVLPFISLDHNDTVTPLVHSGPHFILLKCDGINPGVSLNPEVRES